MIILIGHAVYPLKVKFLTPQRLWIIIVFSASIISFFAEPSTSDDLYRHYLVINHLRNGYYTSPTVLFVWRFLQWIVSKTPYNGFLPAFSSFVIGLLLLKSIQLYSKKQYKSRQKQAIALLYSLGGLGTFSIVSGIRCALVCVTISFVYLKYYREKKWVYYTVAIICCFIHSVGALIFLIVFLQDRFLANLDKKRYFIRVIFGMVFIRILSISGLLNRAMSVLPGEYGALLSIKWSAYIGQSFDSHTSGAWGLFLLLFYMVSIISFVILSRKKVQFDEVSLTLIIISLLGIGFDIFTYRLPYAIGVLQIPVIMKTYELIKKRNMTLVYSWLVLIVSLVMIFSDTYRMCSHIHFNGESYQSIMRILFFIN